MKKYISITEGGGGGNREDNFLYFYRGFFGFRGGELPQNFPIFQGGRPLNFPEQGRNFSQFSGGRGYVPPIPIHNTHLTRATGCPRKHKTFVFIKSLYATWPRFENLKNAIGISDAYSASHTFFINFVLISCLSILFFYFCLCFKETFKNNVGLIVSEKGGFYYWI